MKHSPLTRQRSSWVGATDRVIDMGDGVIGRYFERRVADGTLWAIVGHEPLGPNGELLWHLSISFRSQRGELTRYPSWDEQVHAVRELCPPVPFHMVLPTDEQGYVALHDTTFHWHEYHDDEVG